MCPGHAQHIKGREEEGRRGALSSPVSVTQLPTGVKPGQSLEETAELHCGCATFLLQTETSTHTPSQQLQTLGAAPRVEGPL